jgi:TolA-binding protein
MLSPADLPNDIDALKALLLASERLLQERDEQLADLAVKIEHLRLQIAKLRRMQFGRKSEKLYHQIAQLELQLEDLRADEAEAAREMPAADPRRAKNRCAGLCPIICYATRRFMRRRRMPAPLVAAEGVLQADGRALRGGLGQRA